MKKDQWVSFAQLSTELNIPERSLRHYYTQGKLPPAYRIGRHTRFRRDDFESWFREGEGQ